MLKEENVDALRQNGILIYVKRNANTLATKGRPLSKDLETLKKMEKERLPYYRTAADITFNNVRSQSKGKLTEDLEKFLKRL